MSGARGGVCAAVVISRKITVQYLARVCLFQYPQCTACSGCWRQGEAMAVLEKLSRDALRHSRVASVQERCLLFL